MSTRFWMLVFTLAVVMTTNAAWAQDEAAAAPAVPTTEAKPEPKAQAEVPPEAKPPQMQVDQSEDVSFERVKGFYIEGRGGVFFTLSGARGYSNGQPFTGFDLGYDVSDRFSVQLAYASGYQAANPIMYQDQCALATGCSDYHLDFAMTFFNLAADYDVLYGERWAIELRLGGGAVLTKPSAEPNQAVVDGNVFGGLRLEYYTMLKHFSVGLEGDFYYVLPTGIPAVSVGMSILYNF